jgi:hypothetical protein
MEQQLHELIMPLAEKLCKQLSQHFEQRGQGRLTLFGLELLVWKLLAGLGLELMRGVLGLLLGGARRSSTMECSGCGGKMRRQGQVSRWVTSGFGKFRYERAYYYCRHCHLGKAPCDRAERRIRASAGQAH